MRHKIGFVLMLAMVASPLSVTAQGGEAEPTREEPAVQLKLDDTGVEVVPSPPRTSEGYTPKEMELRVKRARIGLLSTAGVTGVGVVLFGVGVARSRSSQDLDALSRKAVGPWFSGMWLTIGGTVGMIVTGTLLGIRKGELRRLQEARYETPRRVQWNLAQSRLVF